MTTMLSVEEVACRAKAASRKLAALSGKVRSNAVAAMADALVAARGAILAANQEDCREAEANGVAGPLLQRLKITDKVFRYMEDRLREAAALPDPVGRVRRGHVRPSGLRVEQISAPLGVIGVIYESRPNVTSDAAGVCIKSGNAVICRGGSESLRSNIAIADAMASALESQGVPRDALQIVRTADREAVGDLLRQDQFIDVIIPRGGRSLIERVSRDSRIPVIKHYDGICHLYAAADADEQMSVSLTVNSKLEKVEVCNALETLLVDAACAARLVPPLAAALRERGVELRGCPRARQFAEMSPATEEDWSTEYLAPILSVKVVDGIGEAIQHINHYGSGHTDAIVTQSIDFARRFVLEVDSASVLVNASTRLSGGGEYGMGAVIGISTDKLHARGPVGPEELTSWKWVAYGTGHLRE